MKTDLVKRRRGISESDTGWEKESRSRYEDDVPLGMGKFKTSQELYAANLLGLPPLGRSRLRHDVSKHCCFHQCFEHTTEDCRALNKARLDLIREGHLTRFDGHEGVTDGHENNQAFGRRTPRTNSHPG